MEQVFKFGNTKICRSNSFPSTQWNGEQLSAQSHPANKHFCVMPHKSADVPHKLESGSDMHSLSADQMCSAKPKFAERTAVCVCLSPWASCVKLCTSLKITSSVTNEHDLGQCGCYLSRSQFWILRMQIHVLIYQM